MLTGWISDADTAERVVRDGLADFAIMGRALIADSHLVEQYATGRKDEICPCVACGQGCVGNADKIIPIICALTPLSGGNARPQGGRRPDRRLDQGRIRAVQHRRGSGTACQGRPRNRSRITSVTSLKVKKI